MFLGTFYKFLSDLNDKIIKINGNFKSFYTSCKLYIFQIVENLSGEVSLVNRFTFPDWERIEGGKRSRSMFITDFTLVFKRGSSSDPIKAT